MEITDMTILYPACRVKHLNYYRNELIIIVYVRGVCVCVDQRFTEGHNSRFDSQKNRHYLSKALDVIVQ